MSSGALLTRRPVYTTAPVLRGWAVTLKTERLRGQPVTQATISRAVLDGLTGSSQPSTRCIVKGCTLPHTLHSFVQPVNRTFNLTEARRAELEALRIDRAIQCTGTRDCPVCYSRRLTDPVTTRGDLIVGG